MFQNNVSESAHLLDGAQPFEGIIENENKEVSGSPKEEFIAEMQTELGKPNPASKPPMRLPLMKFHTGRLFANLNLVADYNVRVFAKDADYVKDLVPEIKAGLLDSEMRWGISLRRWS